MKSKTGTLNFLFFLIVAAGIIYLLFTFERSENGYSPFWMILALSFPALLRLFPKMRELGVGTVNFFPNLFTYFQPKLKRN